MFEQAPSTAFGDVTIAPSNPNIVWAGTGEQNLFRSSQAGIGVYKSTDTGKTWKDSHLALPLAQFFNIACDMDTPFRVYGSVQDHGGFRGAVNLASGREKRKSPGSTRPRG